MRELGHRLGALEERLGSLERVFVPTAQMESPNRSSGQVLRVGAPEQAFRIGVPNRCWSPGHGYICEVPIHLVCSSPGPSNPYPEVYEALGATDIGHLDPDFLSLLDETQDRLRRAFSTDRLTLPISGTGSADMETSFVNVVRPGDVVVVGVNGLFGERMCDIAGRLGARGRGRGCRVGRTTRHR